jgi:hypothetical protein
MRSLSTLIVTLIVALPGVVRWAYGASENRSDGVCFYLLQDEKMDFETARTKPLSDLALRERPWIASEDIEHYDVSTHCIYLTKKVPVDWERPLLRGTPFVVVADGERCYLGALWTSVSSFLPEGNVPVIWDPGSRLLGGQPDLLDVGLLSVLRKGEPVEDVRNDPRVLKALRRDGQHRAGLGCSLDRVAVRHEGGASSVEYTYTLRNLDQDDLYVLDPKRIHTDFFHDFQNGVRGRRLDGEGSFGWPNPRKKGKFPTPWREVDPAWFSLLESGESMTRTVVMEGLPRVRPGKYECHFSFGSPQYLHGATGTITKQQRQQKDGRIWLGQIDASLTAIVPQEK